ncbi:MAG: hypothetical protein ACE14S_09270 [Candidatus Bathyarchaeia archaeon]
MKRNGSPQSKLEKCLSILSAIKRNQPLTLNQVKIETTIDHATLVENLNFMAKHGVVRTISNLQTTEYSRTQKGENVLRYFQQETQSDESKPTPREVF